MITRAKIESYNQRTQKAKIRIPWLNGVNEKLGTPLNELYEANASLLPGITYTPNVGDLVFVSFEDHNEDKPVILGCVNGGNSKNFPDQSVNRLTAVKEATLPAETKIGQVTGRELSYLKGLSGNIQEQLKGVTEGNKGVDLTNVTPGTVIPSAKLKQLTSSVDKITISTTAGNSVLTLSNIIGKDKEYVNSSLGIKANISSSGRLTISQFPVLISREKVEKGTQSYRVNKYSDNYVEVEYSYIGVDEPLSLYPLTEINKQKWSDGTTTYIRETGYISTNVFHSYRNIIEQYPQYKKLTRSLSSFNQQQLANPQTVAVLDAINFMRAGMALQQEKYLDFDTVNDSKLVITQIAPVIDVDSNFMVKFDQVVKLDLNNGLTGHELDNHHVDIKVTIPISDNPYNQICEQLSNNKLVLLQMSGGKYYIAYGYRQNASESSASDIYVICPCSGEINADTAQFDILANQMNPNDRILEMRPIEEVFP